MGISNQTMPQSKLKEPLMTETIFALLSISFTLLRFALLSMDGKLKSMFILKQILTSSAPFSSLALRSSPAKGVASSQSLTTDLHYDVKMPGILQEGVPLDGSDGYPST